MVNGVENQIAHPLTDGQLKVLMMRIQAIMNDFPVTYVEVLPLVGAPVTKGTRPVVVQAAKPKKKRGPLKGPMGDLAKIVKPWLELAGETQGQPLRVRPSDFPTQDFARIKRAFSALGCNTFGRGRVHTKTVRDSVEGQALDVIVLKPHNLPWSGEANPLAHISPGSTHAA